MRKLIVSLAIITLSLGASAQSEKYSKAMAANLAKMDSARTPADFQALSASFERIANAEKNQWLPYYYAANAQLVYGLFKNVPAENDAIATKANQLLDVADSLEKNNSEISCLRSMAATLQMLVNPMQRYMQFGAAIDKGLADAKKQDPTNPRPYLMQGQNLKNTPPQFGGGCKTAKPVLEKAVSLYETFKPASPLHPNWGKAEAAQNLKDCNK